MADILVEIRKRKVSASDDSNSNVMVLMDEPDNLTRYKMYQAGMMYPLCGSRKHAVDEIFLYVNDMEIKIVLDRDERSVSISDRNGKFNPVEFTNGKKAKKSGP